MQMTNEEILRSYKNAAKPKDQISTLAQLNGCSEDKIRSILIEDGVDGRQLPKKRAAAQAKTAQMSKSRSILAAMKDEEKRLLALKNDLPGQIRALQDELETLDNKLKALCAARELIEEAF